MKKFFFFLCPLLTAMASVACSTDNETSIPARLDIGETIRFVPSDVASLCDPFAGETLSVTDTVWVDGTRSWTAVVETADGGDWLHTNTDERINVTGEAEKYPLVVTFDRYRGVLPRTATLKIYSVDIDAPAVINYTQNAYAPSLELETSGESDIVSSVNGKTYAIVRSNTSWSASVDEKVSTVIPSLSAVSGTDTQAIELEFPVNPDEENTRIARLVVKAEGCESRTLDFVQTKSDRYFLLVTPVEEKRMPYENRIEIPLRSNGPWKAEISDCTFSNAALVPSEGLQAQEGFVFTSDHGFDPEVEEKHATITISREGMEPITVRLSQHGCIHLNVCSYDPEYEYSGKDPYSMENPYRPYKSNGSPFVYPTSFPTSFSSATYKGEVIECETKEGGYVFSCYGQDCGIWLSGFDTGLCIGKRKGDYVLFPALEGYRLSTMYYEASCNVATPYTVRTEEGEILDGGGYTVTSQVFPLSGEHHDIHEHHFTGTLAGERCRLTLEEDLRFISIKELCLVYEK